MMTIAAGFVCTDGIILCADGEHSDGEATHQRDEILAFEDGLILTGSGNHAFIRMMFDKICDECRLAHPVNPSDARETVEKVVYGTFVKHIFKFYRPSDRTRPDVELIVGVRCDNGKLALVKTVESTVYLVDRFDCTGIGHWMFEYWASYLYRENLDMDALSYLAFFMLRETKKTRTDCGGYSLVRKLPSATHFKGPLLTRLLDGHGMMADFAR